MNDRKIYYFNPGYEKNIKTSNSFQQPTKRVQWLMEDLTCLALWYAGPDDLVWSPRPIPDDFLNNLPWRLRPKARVITGPADPLTLDRLFRFESDITTIITPDTRGLNPEDIADTGCRVVVSGKRMSALSERLFGNEGIDIEYYRTSDIIDIAYGLPVNGNGSGTILVTCPCCGNRFTIAI